MILSLYEASLSMNVSEASEAFLPQPPNHLWWLGCGEAQLQRGVGEGLR